MRFDLKLPRSLLNIHVQDDKSAHKKHEKSLFLIPQNYTKFQSHEDAIKLAWRTLIHLNVWQRRCMSCGEYAAWSRVSSLSRRGIDPLDAWVNCYKLSSNLDLEKGQADITYSWHTLNRWFNWARNQRMLYKSCGHKSCIKISTSKKCQKSLS